MNDAYGEYSHKIQTGMKYIPIIIKASKILKELKRKEDKGKFYKLTIGDVLFVSLDIFEKLLHDDDGEFIARLQDDGGLMQMKDKSIDKYLASHEDILRMSLYLGDLENYYKGGL